VFKETKKQRLIDRNLLSAKVKEARIAGCRSNREIAKYLGITYYQAQLASKLASAS
jgi:hypothetical protein